MPLLTLSNVEIQFVERELTQQSYTLAKVLSTTKRVQIIGNKKFEAEALDQTKKVFVMYVIYLGAKMSIHLAWKAQIALLVAEEVIVLTKYQAFVDVFSKEAVVKLSKYSNINKYAIHLEIGKQLPYRPIYSLSLIEFEILKT